ncbi:MAG: hypothetical protein KDI19_17365, partial [Pseudomonadales bacterium]|nr:hypothetical protein [Pseudomonadales bacterium]
HPDTGAGEQAAIFAGFTLFFPAAEIRARYGDVEAYLARAEACVDALIGAGFLLAEDRAWQLEIAAERYAAAIAADGN